jgi:hypothetical protein
VAVAAALVLAVAAAVAAVAALGGGGRGAPAAVRRAGEVPVLVVPGYNGTARSVGTLAARLRAAGREVEVRSSCPTGPPEIYEVRPRRWGRRSTGPGRPGSTWSATRPAGW